MNACLQKRFRELDAMGEWEAPADFDYSRALGEVVHHRRAVGHHLGVVLFLDNQVQDAAYFCELNQIDPNDCTRLAPGVDPPTIGVRFSAFDRMFTILGGEVEPFRTRLPAAIGYLKNHGYVYVSEDDLAVRYDGILTPGTEHWTWFTRFFDYL